MGHDIKLDKHRKYWYLTGSHIRIRKSRLFLFCSRRNNGQEIMNLSYNKINFDQLLGKLLKGNGSWALEPIRNCLALFH